MPKRGWVLIQTPDDWRLANSDGDTVVVCGDDASPECIAEAVESHVGSSGGTTGVVLSLASSGVLSDRVHCAAQDVRRHDSLLFQFESTMPYAAEDLTADFHRVDDGVFGVSVVTESIRPLVDQLEQRHIRVESISPTAVLALQSLMKDDRIATSCIVVWGDHETAEVFVCQERSICKWIQAPRQPAAIGRQVGILAKRYPEVTSVVVLAADDDVRTSIAEMVSQDVIIQSAVLQDRAVATAHRILAGKDEPWFELRRDALATADPLRAIRRPLKFVLAAAGLFLLATAISFWIRARAYDRQVEILRGQEARLFKQVFPNSKVPAGVLSRLESEHARVAGARGTGRSEDVPLPFPALTVLEKFLASLSPDERMQFSSVRISDGDLEVDANLRSHGSAGILVSALQEQGFSVVPPTSEKKDQRSVTSLVLASLRTDDKEAP